MRTTDASAFAWVPGRGPDPAALERLRALWPRRPREPMGEAWFMGEERRMYEALMGDLDRVDEEELGSALEEIASGTQSFGHMKEWDDWFGFLLAHAMQRAVAERGYAYPSLLVSFVTACLSVHADGNEPYPAFAQDVLLTLGRCVTAVQPWREDDPWRWIADANSTQVLWHTPSGRFSAAAYLQLKYLSVEQVAPWVRSILDIPNPVWRGQVLPWLVGIHPHLVGSRTLLDDTSSDWPDAGWTTSHFMGRKAARLHEGTRKAMLDTVRREMNPGRVRAWVDSFANHAALRDKLFDVPERFESLYLV